MTEPADEFLDLLHEAGETGQLHPLDDPGEVIRQQCEQWMQAMTVLRHQNIRDLWPAREASPTQVNNALVEVRARLDQLETLFGQVIALKHATAEAAQIQERRADDAWDDQARAERDSRRPRPEYQGSRERYAYWNIAIRGERAAARQARELADYVRSVYDVMKLAYDGLNETRRDLAARLTHFRWETHMEQ